jgi:VWFA-related protein
VVLFQHVAASGRTHGESVQRTVASEISTNQGAPRGQLYVLVFDQDHITNGAEQRVRLAAEAFLRKRFRPDDRIAVFGLPGPGPSQPFTSNLSAALAELRSVRGGLQRTITPGDRDMTVNEAYEIMRGNDAVLTRFMTNTSGEPSRTGVLPDVTGKTRGDGEASLRDLIKDRANTIVHTADADSRRFLDMMSQMLRNFRGVDGRKTVILFSEGFHSDNLSPTINDVAAAAAETYSVVYAFDLNRRNDNLMATMPAGTDSQTEISSRLEPLATLSSDTNGALVKDALSQLDTALDTLGASEPDYYVIGFPAPSAALADRGGYRHVSVRVNRPGVRVSARTGYVAGPPATPADRQRAINAALAAPFGHQGLRVEYTTYIGQSEHAGLQGVAVSLEAELPVAAQTAGAFADIVFVVRDYMTGQVVQSGSDRIALPRAPAPGSTAGRGVWRTRFDLAAGTYLMRCIVREPGGLIGSADRQFAVRALAGPDAATSDLILGIPGEQLPVRSTAYTGELLSGAVRAYGRNDAQLGGLAATLDLISLAATPDSEVERPVRSIGGGAGASRATDQGVVRDVSFSVPLSDLPAGEYVAHVTVRAGGEVIGDLRRQIDVIDGQRPAAPAPSDAAGTSSAPRPRDVLRGAVVKQMVERAARSSVAQVRQAAEEAADGRWTRSLTALNAVPADADAERLRGLARLDAEDYDGAVVEFEHVFDAQPTDADVAFVLGWARVGAGHHVAAASAFRSAAYLDPTLVPAHLALAETYLRLNQPELATQALQAGLAKVPQALELKQMLESIKK